MRQLVTLLALAGLVSACGEKLPTDLVVGGINQMRPDDDSVAQPAPPTQETTVPAGPADSTTVGGGVPATPASPSEAPVAEVELAASEPVPVATEAPGAIQQPVSFRPADEDMISVESEDGEIFAYDSKTRTCINDNDEEGRNSNKYGQCSSNSDDSLKAMDFSGFQLSGSQWIRSKILNVNFQKAVLEGSDFSGAKIQTSLFAGAKLKDADFSGAEISGSDISDTDVYSEMVDGGIKVGLDNKLPALFSQLENIVREDIRTDELLLADLEKVTSGSGKSGRGPASLPNELLNKAERIRIRILALHKHIDKNRGTIQGMRSKFHELRDQRDSVRGDLDSQYKSALGDKDFGKELQANRKSHARQLRELKKKYVKSHDAAERSRLAEELKRQKAEYQRLNKEIAERKKSSANDIPRIAQLAKEVRDLVGKAKEQRAFLVGVRQENRNLRLELKSLVVELKQIAKDTEKFASR